MADKNGTRKPKRESVYALHLSAEEVGRIRALQRKQIVQPSIAKLVRVALDLGLSHLEKHTGRKAQGVERDA